MAAITDLTWQQLADKLPANAVKLDTGKVIIDVGVLTGTTVDGLTDTGVVKAIAALMSAGFQAQATVNEPQVAGEKLAAFNTPVNGAIASGYVPITRAIVTRAELASATNIVAPNV